MAGLVALLMQIGRGIVAVILGNSLDIAVGFILGDVLSGVFAMVIVGIARKLDGVFEDQKHYLLRISKEEKELEEGFDEG
jgi:protein-S-isoprenylcysteine O-methyltransferase Ste14